MMISRLILAILFKHSSAKSEHVMILLQIDVSIAFASIWLKESLLFPMSQLGSNPNIITTHFLFILSTTFDLCNGAQLFSFVSVRSIQRRLKKPTFHEISIGWSTFDGQISLVSSFVQSLQSIQCDLRVSTEQYCYPLPENVSGRPSRTENVDW